MITEKELLKAIDECEKEPITASKVGKLADLYIIQDHLFGDRYADRYSYSNQIENPTISTSRDTEFLEAVDGRNAEKVWRIIDELAETVKTLYPRVYDKLLERLYDI